ncbi:MAG: 50S ribosomal protein L4 [Verrucomicrobia bacterium]|nr:MAG: 50S ribosomal protein L4 [Verrucomicrobiota bacterium]
MYSIPIHSISGAKSGEYRLDDALVVLDKGGQAVHEAIVAYLANQRRGTASTLTKGEVAGSNRKPWRQKGTGRARAGYRQSPLWRGGGVAFGPKPRSYRRELPRKVKRLALRRAFSERVAAGEVMILEDLHLEQPKTRLFSEIMKKLSLTRGALFVVDKLDRNLFLASRNIPGVEVVAASDVNAYQMLRYRRVVVTSRGMQALEERLAG